jgi:hypothetical protein
LSETTNGDADSVVMNPACQLLKFFKAGLDPGKVDFRDFPFSAKENPRNKKVPDRVGSGLMFGG